VRKLIQDADLRLGDLLERHDLVALLGAHDAGGHQRQKRAIDGILLPAIAHAHELLAHVRALLARAQPGRHFLADGVLVGVAVVADGRQGVAGAFAGALDHLAPV